jgi:hypothetical protein
MHTIKIAEREQQERWDRYVSCQEGAGPYHLFAWRIALENTYPIIPYYLMGENEKGELEGVLPLFYLKPPLVKGLLVSLPYCDYGGMLFSNHPAAARLAHKAVDLAHSLNASLEIRCSAPSQVLDEGIRLYPSSHKIRMLLELPRDPGVLWNGFKSKLRSQIRRPQKEGLEFQEGGRELVKPFYYIFSRNMRELGSPVHSKKLIESVMEAYGESARIGLVTLRGRRLLQAWSCCAAI